jgi:hypothetical protein
MKHMMLDQLDVVAGPPTMTRTEKLTRWAKLIRENTGERFTMFYDLEHLTRFQMAEIPVHSSHNIYRMAAQDPVFQSAGLAGNANLPQIIDFMEITKEELHIFGCGCHGDIGQAETARRVDYLTTIR